MKKFLAVMTALGLAGPAMGADLGLMPAYKASSSMGYDWSGIYAGGHVGGGWDRNDIADPGLGVVGTLVNVPVVQTVTGSGFLGGAQVGSNYQFGKFVIGAEADWSWSHINGANTATFGPSFLPPGLLTLNRTLLANTDWVGTTTTRLGIANGTLLFYGKAGVAYDHTNYGDLWTATVGGQRGGTATLFTGAGASTRIGWTVGSGVEWAVMGPLSVKLEYDFMDFGNKAETLTGTILPGARNGGLAANFGALNSQTVSEVKFGVNYKFMPNIW